MSGGQFYPLPSLPEHAGTAGTASTAVTAVTTRTHRCDSAPLTSPRRAARADEPLCGCAAAPVPAALSPAEKTVTYKIDGRKASAEQLERNGGEMYIDSSDLEFHKEGSRGNQPWIG